VQATYRIVLQNGKLFLRHENEFKDYPKNPLQRRPATRLFVQGLNLQFIRDPRKQVTAFNVERRPRQEY